MSRLNELDAHGKKILEAYSNQKPLGWGMSVHAMFSRWGKDIQLGKDNSTSRGFNVAIKDPDGKWSTVSLYNFIGDCGTLYCNGLNSATKAQLALIEQVASANGFSKVLGTIVGCYEKHEVEAKLSGSWKIVSSGKSNRNPKKDSYVLICDIQNCEWKEYGW